MAFSIPWLETVSKRERQRREEKAQKLMFPFGDEQRTAELAVLRALIRQSHSKLQNRFPLLHPESLHFLWKPDISSVFHLYL